MNKELKNILTVNRQLISINKVVGKLIAISCHIYNFIFFIIKQVIFFPVEYIKMSIRLQNVKPKELDSKKNILCIIPYMVVGGAEKVILNIVEFADNKNYNFFALTTEPATNLWYNNFKLVFNDVFIPTKFIRNNYICFKYLDYIICNYHIDLIITSNSDMAYEYIFRLKALNKDIKIVDINHSEFSVGSLIDQNKYYMLLDKRICISKYLKNYMINKYRGKKISDDYARRLCVIYNGIDTNKFKPDIQTKGVFKRKYSIPENAIIISYVGRFSCEKQPLLFIDIANSVLSMNHDKKLVFIMAGDGPEFNEANFKIDSYGIKNNFILTGQYDDIVSLLNDTHILLVVSSSEGIPFVILESMAMKVPVISTNVGGISEVINDTQNGYLININTNVIESFKEQILLLLNDDDKYNIISENARNIVVSNFSINSMSSSYKHLFNELLRK